MASKKCPMCGTKNDQSAASCSFCGYLFEDYNTSGASSAPQQNQTAAPPIASPPETTSYASAPIGSTGGIPIFSVSKSFVSTLIPTVVYLVFMLLIVASTGFSIFGIAIVVIFLLIPTATTLLTPNKFEFYEDYLRTRKPVGGDAEYQYSALELYDYPTKRKERIYLSVSGTRKVILVPNNPTNKERNQDLKQFLETKVKKRNDTTKNETATQQEEEEVVEEQPAED